MADTGDRTPRRADENGAEERRAQGSTVAALNAYSADVAADSRADLGYTDPDDALQALAGAVEDRTLLVPRLLVLDSLVRLASRRGEELGALDAALGPLLEALVRQAGVPAADVGDAVVTVRGALDSVASLSGAGAPHPWQVFARQAAGALRLTQAEIDKPLCNDSEVVVKGQYRAVGVTVEFHTDATPGELRHFCDPTRWHECSAYQHEMTPWNDPAAIPDQIRPNGWRRDLVETVELSPNIMLVTPLRFTYTIQDQNNPAWVHLDYLLLGKTKEILVDEGALDVRRVTSGKYQGRTRVSAKKAILFADPVLAKWPTIACDTFWTDQVIDAAVGCPDGGATPQSPAGNATTADNKGARLAKAIDDATHAAQTSIGAYAKLAKEAAAQCTEDSPADTGKWLQLTTKTYSQAARDTVKACTSYNAVLKALAESDETGTDYPESDEAGTHS
jgi:hypothetical protein